jgi:hypothetical protein
MGTVEEWLGAQEHEVLVLKVMVVMTMSFILAPIIVPQ